AYTMRGKETTIHDPDGEVVGRGRNLDIIIRKAREFGGVTRITVQDVQLIGRLAAVVVVYYRNDYFGVVDFADYNHARRWAIDRSRANPGTSWFAGCVVDYNFFVDKQNAN